MWFFKDNYKHIISAWLDKRTLKSHNDSIYELINYREECIDELYEKIDDLYDKVREVESKGLPENKEN